MSILTWIKLGAVGALALAIGYFVWDYQSRGRTIAAQELVIGEQQKAIEFYQKAAKIKADTAKQKEEFRDVLKSRDSQRILDYFERMRKLSSPAEGDD